MICIDPDTAAIAHAIQGSYQVVGGSIPDGTAAGEVDLGAYSDTVCIIISVYYIIYESELVARIADIGCLTCSGTDDHIKGWGAGYCYCLAGVYLKDKRSAGIIVTAGPNPQRLL